MNRKSNVTVHICGAEYTISSSESGEYIKRIAEIVDRGITEIKNGHPKVSLSMASVLCAMNLCDEYLKSQDSADNLRIQLKTYFEDSAKLRSELEEARREASRLAGEVKVLRERLQEIDSPKFF